MVAGDEPFGPAFDMSYFRPELMAEGSQVNCG
jgi:hypothetical protein